MEVETSIHQIAQMTDDQNATEQSCSQFDAEYRPRTDEASDWPPSLCDAVSSRGQHLQTIGSQVTSLSV